VRVAASKGEQASGERSAERGQAPAHVGVHVANVLNAAEEVSEEIRAAARAEAETLVARARDEAAAARRDADAAGERVIAEAQALGQEIIATAHGAARAIEEVALDRQARLRLQVRSLEAALEGALAAVRSLDAGLLDPVPDPTGGVPAAVELERLASVVTKRGDRWVPTPEDDVLDRDALLDRARELGIEGRLKMTTAELADAVERSVPIVGRGPTSGGREAQT
jgi:hypothetical protein